MAARDKNGTGGLPDGLIVGLIALLLGVTLLVWTATGLSALFAHGHWPRGVHFTSTPRAMRSLITEPHDLAAAWPGVPRGTLGGPGLFWGVFVAEFLAVLAFVVWVMNVVSQLRKPHPARRAVVPVAEPEPAASAVPTPRRQGADRPKGGDESLDAWFRTVPQAAGGGGTDTPTWQLPAVPEDGAGPRETPLAGSLVGPGTGPGAGPTAGPTTGPTTGPGAGPAAGAAGPARLSALADGEVTRTYALFASPRGDKAKRIVQPAVLAAAGPLVVTTADPDTYHQTAGNRAKLGPVHVYDPTHLLDVPGRLRWAPHIDCELPATARIRATALLAPLRTARADEAIVHDTAAVLLRCWLHAAAVDGRPFRQVQRWAAGGTAAAEAVRVLRADHSAASGWSGELESVLHAHPERRDAAQALIRRLLEPLNSVHIRDACNPSRTGGLDLESFTAERGTLYVVGERIEDPRTHPGAMPLLTALVSSVVEHGRRMAAGSPAGRLDPPLTFVLDDVAALAPVPELPALLADGRATGRPTLAVLRSPEQALARWPSPVWQQAEVRLALGDAADALPTAVPDAVRIR